MIANYMEKLFDLAVETEYEVKLRRLAKTLSNQGLNLKMELQQYARGTGRIAKTEFTRAMKNL